MDMACNIETNGHNEGSSGGAKGQIDCGNSPIHREDEDLSQTPNSNASKKWNLVALRTLMLRIRHILFRFTKFLGPGFMVAVAYIDPGTLSPVSSSHLFIFEWANIRTTGNYATDASAGSSFRFQLLVMVLVSNFIAIYLQALCIKLGTVTGLTLAENIKAHCPRWLNYVLYFFAEAAIIATDIAEVFILPKNPRPLCQVANMTGGNWNRDRSEFASSYTPSRWLCDLHPGCSHPPRLLQAVRLYNRGPCF